MDCVIGNNQSVFVFAASNRLNAIDKALIRKGRFHCLLHVQPPKYIECLQLFDYFGSKYKLDIQDIELLKSNYQVRIDAAGEAYVIHGAEIENLCKEMKLSKLRSTLK